MVRGLYAPGNLGDESATFPHINFPYLTNSDPSSYPHISLRPAGGNPNWGLALVTETGAGTNSFFANLVKQGTGEYTISDFSHSATVIVEKYGTAFTVPAAGLYTLDIHSTHAYYDTYFLNLINYRTANNWFIHVKAISADHVVLDYCNMGNTAISVAANTVEIMWLLIRNNTKTS